MNALRKMARILCTLLALSVGLLSLPAQAAMVGTQSVVTQQQITVDRAQLMAALDRADIQQQLAAYGVDPKQAKERVAAMTDDELKAVNGKLGQLPAGGDVWGVVILIFVILLVTDILGLTHIFPFVHHR